MLGRMLGFLLISVMAKAMVWDHMNPWRRNLMHKYDYFLVIKNINLNKGTLFLNKCPVLMFAIAYVLILTLGMWGTVALR